MPEPQYLSRRVAYKCHLIIKEGGTLIEDEQNPSNTKTISPEMITLVYKGENIQLDEILRRLDAYESEFRGT